MGDPLVLCGFDQQRALIGPDFVKFGFQNLTDTRGLHLGEANYYTDNYLTSASMFRADAVGACRYDADNFSTGGEVRSDPLPYELTRVQDWDFWYTPTSPLRSLPQAVHSREWALGRDPARAAVLVRARPLSPLTPQVPVQSTCSARLAMGQHIRAQAARSPRAHSREAPRSGRHGRTARGRGAAVRSIRAYDLGARRRQSRRRA